MHFIEVICFVNKIGKIQLKVAQIKIIKTIKDSFIVGSTRCTFLGQISDIHYKISLFAAVRYIFVVINFWYLFSFFLYIYFRYTYFYCFKPQIPWRCLVLIDQKKSNTMKLKTSD